MSDVIGVLLASISTDAALLPAFQEACRMGYVRAEGRRVKFVASECETGRWKVTEVVEAKWERIPEDDFSDLSLKRWDQEWRLEGARRWFDPEPAFEPKEWRSIRFRQSEDLPPGQSSPAALTRRAGGKGALRQGVADFLARRYPTGIPQSCKIDTICDEFKCETGRSVSNRTVRRVLGRK
jgi:hypothetical protein